MSPWVPLATISSSLSRVHLMMGRNVTVRRIFTLACLFLAAAPLLLASGQETLQDGLQEDGVEVDELADATGLSEVSSYSYLDDASRGLAQHVI